MENKIKKLFFGLLLALSMLGCKNKYKEIANYEGSDYILQIQISDNINHVDRLSNYGPKKIILENEILKECLSALLDKDTSLIKFKSPSKGDIMLKGMYVNLRKNVSEKETKLAFLKELQKAMKFTLIAEYPENKYQLVIKNNTLLNNYLTKNSKDTSSVYSGKNVFKAYNSTVPFIVNGLNKVYSDSAVFISESTNDNRYSFNLENIPFDKLKMYLETNIGLSFVTLDKVEGAKTTIEVVFNN